MKNSLILGLLVCALAACGGGGDAHFEKPAAETVALLKETPFPAHALGGPIRKSVASAEGDNVIVQALIDDDGKERARIAYTVAPDGTGSTVRIELRPPAGETELPKFDHAMVLNFARNHTISAVNQQPIDITGGTQLEGSEEGKMASQGMVELTNNDDGKKWFEK